MEHPEQRFGYLDAFENHKPRAVSDWLMVLLGLGQANLVALWLLTRKYGTQWTMTALFSEALADVPVVAVLRGLAPARAAGVAGALVRAGVRVMEVTLNSEGALDSIRRMRAAVPDGIIVGAGTVLRPADVTDAKAAGAAFLVMPNLDPAVMAAGVEAGLPLMPGVMTPSEAFAAIAMGASVLKLFPAEVVGPAGLKALRAVLPRRMAPIYAVGGVDVHTMANWVEAGADGFGIGGSLFKPGFDDEEVFVRTRALVEACKTAFGK
jgi:2-dehydro-3-deoxyphosphogalactonate aldolase